ncbi:MAG: tetratricopeptide repeat protein [Planctomycetia bacterium]|nr:tetratricopeptide repeat protein [Planctomycetia bacterium]
MSRETLYLFRHALLRDAAYQLQMPAERARLHAEAFAVIERLCGGRAPEPAAVDAVNPTPQATHPTDPFAEELAAHARLGGGDPALQLRYLLRSVAIAIRDYRNAAAQDLWLRIAALVSGGQRGIALRQAGLAAARRGRAPEAERLFVEAIRVLHGAGSRREEGNALGNLASLLRETGRLEEAERNLERSLLLLRGGGHRIQEAMMVANKANLCLELDHFEEAEVLLNEALAVFREAGDLRSERTTRGNLANLYRRSGRHGEAEVLYAEVLAADRAAGDRRHEGVTLGNLATLYQATGRIAEAESALREALPLHSAAGNRRHEGASRCDLGLNLLRQGRRGEAVREWRDGIAILRELRDRKAAAGAVAEMRKACGEAGVAPLEE